MSGNKHPKGHETNDIDLKANPGIGQGAAINNVQTTSKMKRAGTRPRAT